MNSTQSVAVESNLTRAESVRAERKASYEREPEELQPSADWMNELQENAELGILRTQKAHVTRNYYAGER